MTASSVKTQPRTGKRIHSVTIKRMVDDSPDTSWLGEYANASTSEHSIDRTHSLECRSQSGAQEYMVQLYDTNGEEAGGAVFMDRAKADEYAAFHAPLQSGFTFEIEERNAECDCGEQGDMSRGEYRYFNPSSNYKDETPENTRKYVRQDYERMEQLNRGDWCFIGIRAEADYFVGMGRGHSLIQTVTSGGLWGIESDSDADYVKSIEQEELSSLREQLEAIGFSKRAISAAFREIEHVEG